MFSVRAIPLVCPHTELCDCAIDLLPAIMPPRSHIYTLSLTEQRAMEEQVHENFHIYKQLKFA